MENSTHSNEISLGELINKISYTLKENKLIYALIFLLVFLGGIGVIVKSKMNPEYKAQVLLGSEVLKLPILKVIIDDINIEIDESEASSKFITNKNLYADLDDLSFGELKISAADDRDKDLNVFKLEVNFTEPSEDIDFSEVSSFIINDITNKVKGSAFIQENKNEVKKNIEVIDESILNAKETETAVRENIKSNKDVSIIGITNFYTELNNLISKKNVLEKQLLFYEDANLIYKITDFSFENNSLSKIELLAYCIFLSVFFSLIFTIYKLILV